MTKNIIRIIKYFVFTVVFIYSFSWTQINLMLSSFGQGKIPVTVIENKEIQQLIYNKTGVNIKTIKISETLQPFGMMIGIPTQPQLVLSRGLYNTFNPQELEYVILHEAGHYILWHSVIEFAVGFSLFVAGIILLRKIKNFKKSLLISIILGLTFGVLMVQLGKVSEIQADNFTVKRISDPKGMIDATNKFKNYHGKKYSQNNNPIMQFLFYRANPYENRIKMAEKEIIRRNEK